MLMPRVSWILLSCASFVARGAVPSVVRLCSRRRFCSTTSSTSVNEDDVRRWTQRLRELHADERIIVAAELPGKGRGLVASRAIAPGTTLFEEEATLLVPHDGQVAGAVASVGAAAVCPYCLRSLHSTHSIGESSVVCDGCSVRYCSATCRDRAAQHSHGLLCGAPALRELEEAAAQQGRRHPLLITQLAAALMMNTLAPALQRTSRPHCDDRRGGADALSLVFALRWASLQDAVAADASSPAGLQLQREYDTFCRVLAHRGLPARHAFPFAFYVQALGVLALNTFALHDDAPASALLLAGSLFNHSCEPNTEWRSRGRCVRFGTRQHIPAGAELCISYIDTDAAPAQRRAALSHYLFECNCPRCRAGV